VRLEGDLLSMTSGVLVRGESVDFVLPTDGELSKRRLLGSYLFLVSPLKCFCFPVFLCYFLCLVQTFSVFSGVSRIRSSSSVLDLSDVSRRTRAVARIHGACCATQREHRDGGRGDRSVQPTVQGTILNILDSIIIIIIITTIIIIIAIISMITIFTIIKIIITIMFPVARCNRPRSSCCTPSPPAETASSR
jgi:hypothetical protein